MTSVTVGELLQFLQRLPKDFKIEYIDLPSGREEQLSACAIKSLKTVAIHKGDGRIEAEE